MSSSNMKKLYIGIGVVALLLVGFVIGYTTKPRAASYLAGAVGDTQSTGKIAQIVANLATSSMASLLNSDTNDRIIDSIYYDFTGVGTMNSAVTGSMNAFTLQAGTSTDIYQVTSANKVLFTTVSTSTPDVYVASTTAGSTGSAFIRVWKAGTYLNFFSGTTTTNGQQATSSTATGIIGVKYFGGYGAN